MARRRPSLGVQLICLQKTVWCLGLVAIAVTLLILHASGQTHPFQYLFENELREDPHDFFALLIIGWVPTVPLNTELFLGAAALVYALIEAVEAWGLWLDVLWVEMLVIAETAALLPYEVWELTRAFSPLKLVSLALNVLIVWYLTSRYLRKRRRDVFE